MKMYLAYSSNYHDLLVQEHSRLIVSYGRRHGDRIVNGLPEGFNDYMIDSGGFQLAMGTQERGVFIEAYTMWVKFILKKYGRLSEGGAISGWVGLDTADWKESLRNYEYMRKEGVTPIPVWKAFWPDDVLSYLCDQYGYVAIGGIAFGASKKVLRNTFERVIMDHGDTKFHGLGVGIRGGFAYKSFRPYSVDVSTWSVPARYGHDIILDPKQVLKEVKLPEAERQRLRDDKNYENEMVLKAIRLMNSLEVELEKMHSDYQLQFRKESQL